jgi:hypothetical protein
MNCNYEAEEKKIIFLNIFIYQLKIEQYIRRDTLLMEATGQKLKFGI